METKLTLRLDDRLIARAKSHASASGRSLSQLTAALYDSLEGPVPDRAAKPTPQVDSLRGSLRRIVMGELGSGDAEVGP